MALISSRQLIIIIVLFKLQLDHGLLKATAGDEMKDFTEKFIEINLSKNDNTWKAIKTRLRK